MNLGLAHKTVIVTGGAAGLGAAIGAAFGREGANRVIFDLGAPPQEPPDAASRYVQGDVTRPPDVARAFAAAQEAFGGVDILVNNAGIWPTSLVAQMDPAAWERTLQVNLTGAFLFSQHFVRLLQAAKRPGCIVNIVSPVAYQGSASGHSAYAAAKAGLVSFTRSLALEVAADGIRVIAVAPGVMFTEMTRASLEARGEDYLRRIPLGRFIEPEEVAQVVVFMASEGASCITGATINATGGMLAH